MSNGYRWPSAAGTTGSSGAATAVRRGAGATSVIGAHHRTGSSFSTGRARRDQLRATATTSSRSASGGAGDAVVGQAGLDLEDPGLELELAGAAPVGRPHQRVQLVRLRPEAGGSLAQRGRLGDQVDVDERFLHGS